MFLVLIAVAHTQNDLRNVLSATLQAKQKEATGKQLNVAVIRKITLFAQSECVKGDGLQQELNISPLHMFISFVQSLYTYKLYMHSRMNAIHCAISTMNDLAFCRNPQSCKAFLGAYNSVQSGEHG